MDKINSETILFGITGFKASGKSFIAKIITKKYNIPIFDIDILCSELLSPGKPIHKKIITHLGYDLLTDTGFIDILKLTKMLKTEPWVKTFIDGEIEDELNNFVFNLKSYLHGNSITCAGIESNLLINSSIKNYVDKIIFVKASSIDRYKRLQKIYPKSIIENILKMENDIDYSNFDYVLNNDMLNTNLLQNEIDCCMNKSLPFNK